MHSIRFDFNDPAFVADPYPQLAAWRELAAHFFDPDRQRIFFTRYEDITALLRECHLGRSFLPSPAPHEPGWSPDPDLAAFHHFEAIHLMDKEPPEHTRLRGLLGKAFTPLTISTFAAAHRWACCTPPGIAIQNGSSAPMSWFWIARITRT